MVVAEAGGRRAGLTVSSLVSLSLDPPLIGISLSRSASLIEVLREASSWTVSILAGDQDHLAQHFARSVPPLVLWEGIPVRSDDPRLIDGALGWITARTISEVDAGDHTFFIGAIDSLEEGAPGPALVYVDRRYTAQ